MKRILHLLGYWLWIGFAGGAIVLLLVATPIESRLKSHGTPQVRIDLILSGIALAWVVASFLAARTVAARASSPRRRLFAHITGVVVCAVVFMGFLQAGAGGFGFARAAESKEGRFTFGPYPDEKTIARLKQEGTTGVISLLNPLIPFEAVLLEKERKAVATAGLKMIEVPMLPWVSANRESLDKLAQLASHGVGQSGTGRERYYVHCYLGHHRVELARSVMMDAQGLRTRSANAMLPEEFELGPLYNVGDSIIVGPLPSQEEFIQLRSVGVRHIVSLLDPDTDTIWIKCDRDATHDLHMELHCLPANNPTQMASAATAIKSLQGKVYVHAYQADTRTRGVIAKLER